MRHVVCAVFDSAAQLYGRPFTAATQAAARRAFSDEVNRPSSEFGAHPEDFVLFLLGYFDDHAGRVEGVVPEQLVRATEVKG